MPDEKMSLATALDLAKAYHTKQVVPFLRLAEVLDVASKAESRAAAAVKEMQQAQAAIDAIRGEVPAEKQRLEEQRAITANGIAASKKELAEITEAHAQRVKELAADIRKVTAEHAAAMKKLTEQREQAEREYAEGVAIWQDRLRAAQEKHANFLRSLGV